MRRCCRGAGFHPFYTTPSQPLDAQAACMVPRHHQQLWVPHPSPARLEAAIHRNSVAHKLKKDILLERLAERRERAAQLAAKQLFNESFR